MKARASDQPTQPIGDKGLQTGGPAAYIKAQELDLRSWARTWAKSNGAMMWHPSALGAQGWYHSQVGQIVDGQGAMLPWLPYSATTYLDTIIEPCWKVLEYGLGSSSFWWAQRVEQLTIIEHDPVWVAKLGHLLPQNVELVQVDQSDQLYKDYCYERAQHFDLISVDGKRRNSVLKRVARTSKPGGYILFDDSQKVRYYKALAKLERKGMDRLDFWGPKPLQSYAGKTSLFLKPEEPEHGTEPEASLC